MGKWYLAKLTEPKMDDADKAFSKVFDRANVYAATDMRRPEIENGVTVYRDIEVERLQGGIAAARSRLAELEALYTKEKRDIDHIRAVGP